MENKNNGGMMTIINGEQTIFKVFLKSNNRKETH